MKPTIGLHTLVIDHAFGTRENRDEEFGNGIVVTAVTSHISLTSFIVIVPTDDVLYRNVTCLIVDRSSGDIFAKFSKAAACVKTNLFCSSKIRIPSVLYTCDTPKH